MKKILQDYVTVEYYRHGLCTATGTPAEWNFLKETLNEDNFVILPSLTQFSNFSIKNAQVLCSLFLSREAKQDSSK